MKSSENTDKDDLLREIKELRKDIALLTSTIDTLIPVLGIVAESIIDELTEEEEEE